MMGLQELTLGEIYDVRDGTHDSPKYQDDGYPLVTSKNLKQGALNLDKIKYISEEDYLKINERSAVHMGDVLLAMIGTIGNPIVIEIEPNFAIKNVALFKISSEQNSRFLKYYLESPFVTEKMTREAKGTTQKFVGLGYLRSFPMLLPPLTEQKRIVAILDQAFAEIDKARANAEQNLKNARELFESYLQQIFSQRGEGWVENTLGNICSFKHGFAFKSEYFTKDSDLVLLTPGNFFEKGGYKDRGEKQKYYKGPFPEEFLLAKGSLLVAMTEQAAGLLGSPALVPENSIFLHNQRLGLVELIPDFQENVSLEFLFHFFNTNYFRAKVQKTASGLKVRHTSPKKMQVISVWIPESRNEQDRIAREIFKFKEKTIGLERVYKQKLNQLDELKKSILQKAFTGELTQNNHDAAA
ncbi:MAG: restriction endonuclease subunit S [Piscirickettsiaceae bacterium]|nr:MAG: restriction endonuclease subunit S [Piscirickettsiaceae bacterium]